MIFRYSTCRTLFFRLRAVRLSAAHKFGGATESIFARYLSLTASSFTLNSLESGIETDSQLSRLKLTIANYYVG